ncbi:uncharacterized protein LOC131631984 [Vicia villosa]|uniref:uncharacterized protein LOC131631984 n=1 Tax=Vicia villosa TaxID=3911 RepID=UPI00273ACBBF|nr:uncharacterized protein LOC131631984 [Vicia villosa]
MKKLYHKATVHPTPPVITDQLSFLPATILTLAAALSTEDREVLAYLIYCSSAATPTGNAKRSTVRNTDHATLFNCSCFRCYTSYWVRWDESPNRELIHEIIDAFEEWLAQSSKGGKKGKGKKEKRNKKGFGGKRSGPGCSGELNRSVVNELAEMESVGESSNSSSSGGGGGGSESGERVVVVGGGGGGGEDEEKGSVRKFVSFIGERIWGVWG